MLKNPTKRRSSSKFQWRIIIRISLVVAIVAYFLHVPLPDEITERQKQHWTLPLFRLFYYYPSKTLGNLGWNNWRVTWTKISLKYLSQVIGMTTSFEGGIKQKWNGNLSNVPVRVYVPETRNNDGAIVFIHGGGFVTMDVDSYDHVVEELVRQTGMVAVSIDYRLAPAHVFPAAVNDCENAVISFLTKDYKEYKVNPAKVVIMGDSAGGNLATVVALKLRHKKNLPTLKVEMQVLIYPVVQLIDMMTPSFQFGRRVTDNTGLLDTETLALWYLSYFGIDPIYISSYMVNGHMSSKTLSSPLMDHIRHDRLSPKFTLDSFYVHPEITDENVVLNRKLEPFLFNPEVSPIMSASLSGLPKSLVVTCEFDVLRDEGYWYYDRMRNEGVYAHWIHYDHGFHGMLNVYSGIKLGRKAFQDIAGFILSNIDS